MNKLIIGTRSSNLALTQTKFVIKKLKEIDPTIDFVIKKIKTKGDVLLDKDLNNILFARMTGSGSTMIAYFNSKKDAENAYKILKKKYKNYWCILSKTI